MWRPVQRDLWQYYPTQGLQGKVSTRICRYAQTPHTLGLISEGIYEGQSATCLRQTSLCKSRCVVDKSNSVFESEWRVLLGCDFRDGGKPFGSVEDAIWISPGE